MLLIFIIRLLMLRKVLKDFVDESEELQNDCLGVLHSHYMYI